MTWDELKTHRITVYSTPWCGDCRRFKRILSDNGVDFQEVDIDADPDAATELEKKTGRKAIPFAEINGVHMIRGWHKEMPGRWDDKTFLKEVGEAVG